jgi:hypothetical protein
MRDLQRVFSLALQKMEDPHFRRHPYIVLVIADIGLWGIRCRGSAVSWSAMHFVDEAVGTSNSDQGSRKDDRQRAALRATAVLTELVSARTVRRLVLGCEPPGFETP